MREDKLKELLKEADCVPEAPDCRAKVMQRITATKPVRSFVWAYAAAAVLMLIIGGAILFKGADRAAKLADKPNQYHHEKETALKGNDQSSGRKPSTKYKQKAPARHKKPNKNATPPKPITTEQEPPPTPTLPQYAYAQPTPHALSGANGRFDYDFAKTRQVTPEVTALPQRAASPESAAPAMADSVLTMKDTDSVWAAYKGTSPTVSEDNRAVLDRVTTPAGDSLALSMKEKANGSLSATFAERSCFAFEVVGGDVSVAPNEDYATKADLDSLKGMYASRDWSDSLNVRFFQRTFPFTSESIFKTKRPVSYRQDPPTRLPRRITAVDCLAGSPVLYAGVVGEKEVESNKASVSSIGYGYQTPDPMELARSFAKIERLASDGSLAARWELISTAYSTTGRFQVRRFAWRMVSRVASPGDLRQVPAEDRTSPLWALRKIAEIRIASRASCESKKTLASKLKRFLYDLSAEMVAADKATKLELGIHQMLAQQEIGFQIADAELPTSGFPPQVTDYSTEVAIYRMRRAYSRIADPQGRAKLLIGRIGPVVSAKAIYESEAAVVLLEEIGEPALRVVIATMNNRLPKTNPPPWTEDTKVFHSCSEILAGIGGEQAAAALRQNTKSRIPHVAQLSRHYLEWVEAGLKYPSKYRRLFDNPMVAE